MTTTAEVQATIGRLRAERAAAGDLVTAAQATAGDLERQITELRKREDLTGELLTQPIITATVLREDAQRQGTQAAAQVKELTARITALESELPAIQRTEQRQRLSAHIDGLRPLAAAYASAAGEFLAAHAAFSQGYNQASMLAGVDPSAPSVGAMPLSESEMATAMRRAAVGASIELPARLTR